MASKLIEEGPKSPEYTAFRRCYQVLVVTLSTQPIEFCEALFSRGYLSIPTKIYVREDNFPADKARKILNDVIDGIETNKSWFHGFLEVLDKPSTAAMYRKLTAMYKKQLEGDEDDEIDYSYYRRKTTNTVAPSLLARLAEPDDRFPFLDLSQVNESVGFMLKSQLSSDTKGIIMSFSQFSSSVRKSLTDNPLVPFEAVKEFILSFEIVNEDYRERIRPNETVIEIFINLRVAGYISFLNYNMIECLVHRFGTAEDHRELETYLIDIRTYCKRSVFQVPMTVYTNRSRDSEKVLVVKFKEKDVTLNRMEEFLYGMFKVTGDGRLADFHLYGVKKTYSCIDLTFWVAANLFNRIFPLTAHQQSAVSSLGASLFFPEESWNMEETVESLD